MTSFRLHLLLVAVAAVIVSAAAAAAALLPEPLAAIPPAVEEAIRAGETPGAVIVIGHQDQVVLRQAFGHRSLAPPQPMTPDAVFDVASLTKVVATTPAVLQLVEKGRLQLDAPAARYWPAFKGHGKERITLRQLLTHYSGLRPGMPPQPAWSGYNAALKQIAGDTPTQPAESRFIYSDLNFTILGELVRRVSGDPLEAYCRRYIFEPLGMKDTGFKPPRSLNGRLAPTMEGSFGVVHDPDTRRMGGVSGAAGLFSTADDLACFAQTLLDQGRRAERQLLSPAAVKEMAQPQSPDGRLPARGLGWAIHSPSGNWSEMLPAGTFGHKGFTGTLLWVDPETRTYLIVLSNRVYPDGEAREETLRDKVFSLAVQATGRPAPASPADALSQRPAGVSTGRVLTGVDVLAARKFAALADKRVGLITNHTGLDAVGRRTIDLLARAPGVKLRAVFSPEHGLSGKADWKVASGRDASTNLPVYSLYGETRRPKPEMLQGLDAMVFDVQDAGARFYTYMSTMAYAMEAAAQKGIEFVVLDRPNPISASRVEGPVMDSDLRSFTGYFPLPVRHGMTLGELARMFNGENRMGVRLKVIPMQGYRRDMWFDETGLAWVNPSPNLRSLDQAVLYPGVALSEASNVSVGRGTDTPFELLGAPWVRADELVQHLRGRRIPGVEFEPAAFTPDSSVFAGQPCHGIRMVLKDRGSLNAVGLGVEILCALHRLYPGVFQLEPALHMVGSRAVVRAIADGLEPESIVASWQPQLDEFRRRSGQYLLY
ncbi:MAG: DUF1343 domain-containing protein [Desulfobacterales bacterium]|nr:DUF1343 domain-containing protein [Desulfobacterales bacterium]